MRGTFRGALAGGRARYSSLRRKPAGTNKPGVSTVNPKQADSGSETRRENSTPRVNIQREADETSPRRGFNEPRIISLFGGNSRRGSGPESAAIYIKPDPGTIATFYSYTKRGGARCARALAAAPSLDRAMAEMPREREVTSSFHAAIRTIHQPTLFLPSESSADKRRIQTADRVQRSNRLIEISPKLRGRVSPLSSSLPRPAETVARIISSSREASRNSLHREEGSPEKHEQIPQFYAPESGLPPGFPPRVLSRGARSLQRTPPPTWSAALMHARRGRHRREQRRLRPTLASLRCSRAKPGVLLVPTRSERAERGSGESKSRENLAHLLAPTSRGIERTR